MSSLRSIKERIANVTSVEQLIRAMYMVSSTKLQKARAQLEGLVPMQEGLQKIIDDLASREESRSIEVFKKREVRNSLYMIFTSDRGLSGGYNSKINKFVLEHLKDVENEKLLIVGSIGNEFFRRNGKNIIRAVVDVADAQIYYASQSLAEWATDLYLAGEVDEICVGYTVFKNVLSYEPVIKKVLPISNGAEDDDDYYYDNYLDEKIYEPDLKTYIEELIPLYLHMYIFRAFSEAHTSEQAARMVSMDAAGKNADEIMEDLTHSYNRQRQAEITQELNEIVGSRTIMTKEK